MATSRRMRLTASVLVLVAATTAGAVAAAVTSSDHHAAAAEEGAPATGIVNLLLNDCGSGWTPGPAGPQELTVHNSDYRPGELRVVGVGADNGREVFGQVEPLGPDTTVTLHVSLSAGDYALQCLYEEQQPVTGPARTITGDARGVRGVVPIPQDQLLRATIRYTDWVRRQMPALEQQTRSLARAIGVGNDAQAEAGLAHRARRLRTARGGLRRVRRPGRCDQRAAQRAAEGGPRPRLHRLPPGRDGALAAGLDQPGRTPAAGRRALRRGRQAAQGAVHRPDRPAHLLDPGARDRREPAPPGPHRPRRPRQPQRPGHGRGRARRHPERAGPDPQAAEGSLPAREELFRAVDHARAVTARLSRGPLGHRAIADWPVLQRQRVDALVAALAERLAPVASVLEPRRVT